MLYFHYSLKINENDRSFLLILLFLLVYKKDNAIYLLLHLAIIQHVVVWLTSAICLLFLKKRSYCDGKFENCWHVVLDYDHHFQISIHRPKHFVDENNANASVSSRNFWGIIKFVAKKQLEYQWLRKSPAVF